MSTIEAIVTLLGVQLAGEVAVRLLGLPVPGPVVGALALALVLAWRGTIPAPLAGTAHTLLRNLSLLFVPAAVGVVEHRAVFADHGIALVAALVVSTVAALCAAALAFRLTVRLMGPAQDRP